MSVTTDLDLTEYCQQTAAAAKAASYELASLDAAVKNQWLRVSADALVDATTDILAANELDLAAAPGYGLTDATVDGCASILLVSKASPTACEKSRCCRIRLEKSLMVSRGLVIADSEASGAAGRRLLYLRKPSKRYCGCCWYLCEER